MRRVLLVHPSLQPPGGGNCVAAWLLEALRDDYDLTLFGWTPPRLEPVNRYFGTSLRPADFELRLAPSWLRCAVHLLPIPAALLRYSLMTRLAWRLLRRERFGAVISGNNEMDLGLRGIQYVHYPTGFLPRPDCDYRWYHHLPLSLSFYRRVCDSISPGTPDGIRRNLTLVNSDWTGRRYRDLYGTETVTVYPPVPGDFEELPWRQRRDGFVCIGRISPEKNLERVIEILAAVRERWPRVELHLVGSPDNRAYTRRILALAAREQAWVRVHRDLPRAELVRLVASNRYGIHGMIGEHFGIAVAELQRAGCIVFVPEGGGQVEIVDGDERLIYGGREDAVAKIDRVLADELLRESIRREVAARRDRFSARRFTAEIRAVVGGFGDPIGPGRSERPLASAG